MTLSPQVVHSLAASSDLDEFNTCVAIIRQWPGYYELEIDEGNGTERTNLMVSVGEIHDCLEMYAPCLFWSRRGLVIEIEDLEEYEDD